MLSDQQLVTAVSILGVGYIKHCSITQYHFYIVSMLALASFDVYQASVITLRSQFSRSPAVKTWRTMWMTALFVMVLVAQIIVYNDNFLWNFGSPVQCIWDDLTGTFNDEIFYFSIIIIMLVWGYLSMMAILWPAVFAILPRISTILIRPAQFHIWVMRHPAQSQQKLADLIEYWREN
ncbi:hypothetical protein F4779DRAFT_610868 [Xylariaceae sp. FL0662B]|nr:hypothetical protein F4779DRAFT_610868 [Xylariaceae sp. FL0662B]